METNFFKQDFNFLISDNLFDAVHEVLNTTNNDDPFYIFEASNIFKKLQHWHETFPRIHPHYAVKCNASSELLAILSKLDIGFDCASKNEIKEVMQFIVDPSRIIFAQPSKFPSHLILAAALGVERMTFDNEEELYKIKEIITNPKLVLRIRSDDEEALCQLGIKFGADPNDALRLLSTAKQLGLDVIGVSFHVGSGCRNPDSFFSAIKDAKKVFEEAVTLGFEPYLLDIGGGFPGETGCSLDKFGHSINAAIDTFFPNSEDIEVIAEPGRYFATSAFTLVTKVIGKKKIINQNGQGTTIAYYINDGIYGSFTNAILYKKKYFPTLLKKTSIDDAIYVSTIWGPTCDGIDKIAQEIPLPELYIGDYLLWSEMGGYSVALATTFNGFSKPLIHIVMPSYPTNIVSRKQTKSSRSFVMYAGRFLSTFWYDLLMDFGRSFARLSLYVIRADSSDPIY